MHDEDPQKYAEMFHNGDAAKARAEAQQFRITIQQKAAAMRAIAANGTTQEAEKRALWDEYRDKLLPDIDIGKWNKAEADTIERDYLTPPQKGPVQRTAPPAAPRGATTPAATPQGRRPPIEAFDGAQ